jgi:hypothetical protein
MEKQYIGFDPGKTGHGVMIQGNQVTKFRFPVIGKEYDLQGMLDIFSNFDKTNCHVVIEDVKALQKPFQAGNWSLSRGKTILEVACMCYGLPHTLVHSKTWQKEIWQGVPQMKKDGATDTKNMTLVAIKRLFPEMDLRVSERATKPDEGVVDALALAEYCRRKF